MSMILINYDLVNPGQDYDAIIEHIKSYDGWAHVMLSCWAVSTTKTVVQVRDGLIAVTDRNDKFYVVDITDQSAAWIGLPTTVSDWLK